MSWCWYKDINIYVFKTSKGVCDVHWITYYIGQTMISGKRRSYQTKCSLIFLVYVGSLQLFVYSVIFVIGDDIRVMNVILRYISSLFDKKWTGKRYYIGMILAIFFIILLINGTSLLKWFIELFHITLQVIWNLKETSLPKWC